MNQIMLLNIKFCQNNVENNVLQSLNFLCIVLLDAGSVIHLSKVPADVQVVPLMLAKFNHVSVELELQIRVFGIFKKSG